MSNLEIVREEFARQAATFDDWAKKTDEKSGVRFVEALGAAARGRILDVACGPGVISEAVARHAASVVALDATGPMLERARARCASAGLANVTFEIGDAHALSFGTGAFDGVVSRLAVHHFADPTLAVGEMVRVLKPGGVLVIADVTVSPNPDDAALQNAIETLRDPSHVAMLSRDTLRALLRDRGLEIVSEECWRKERGFDEWMGMVGEPSRALPLKTVVQALAEAGRAAGMGLALSGGRLSFFHDWCLIAGRKPM